MYEVFWAGVGILVTLIGSAWVSAKQELDFKRGK